MGVIRSGSYGDEEVQVIMVPQLFKIYKMNEETTYTNTTKSHMFKQQ